MDDEPGNMGRELLLELLPLLQRNIDLNIHVDIVKFYLDRGVDVNALDKFMVRLLHHAVQKSHIDVAKFLLEHRTNVNAVHFYMPPLYYAVMGSDIGIVKLLLEYGANVNTSTSVGNNSLHRALQMHHVNIVRLLLEHGANVDAPTYEGYTPLHCAAQNHYVDIVKLFLEHGANVNALTNKNETALHIALLNGCQADIVKLLLDHGSNVNAKDHLGLTPLHDFLRMGKPDISVFLTLMKYGAHVNAVSNDGICVLTTALRNTATSYDIIKLLLVNGAIPDIYNETNILVNITQPERYHFAKLLIPFIVLTIFINRGMFQVLDRFKYELLVHINDSNNRKRFLKIARSCVEEIKNMSCDFVCEDTLFQFVSEYCSQTTGCEQSISMYDIDTLLFLLKINKYILCRDIIYAAIKHSAIVERVCELEVCYQTANNDTIILNYACIDGLTKYMSKDDVINLSIVFCDEFSDHECSSRYTSKRSVEENDEIVCKKPRH